MGKSASFVLFFFLHHFLKVDSAVSRFFCQEWIFLGHLHIYFVQNTARLEGRTAQHFLVQFTDLFYLIPHFGIAFVINTKKAPLAKIALPGRIPVAGLEAVGQIADAVVVNGAHNTTVIDNLQTHILDEAGQIVEVRRPLCGHYYFVKDHVIVCLRIRCDDRHWGGSLKICPSLFSLIRTCGLQTRKLTKQLGVTSSYFRTIYNQHKTKTNEQPWR